MKLFRAAVLSISLPQWSVGHVTTEVIAAKPALHADGNYVGEKVFISKSSTENRDYPTEDSKASPDNMIFGSSSGVTKGFKETRSKKFDLVSQSIIGRKLDLMSQLSEAFPKDNGTGRDLAEDEGDDYGGHGDEEIHVEYDELYNVLVFLLAVFVAGQISIRFGLPSLVGEIIAGFLLGPELVSNFLSSYKQALVLFGDIGLIMLVLEAGIDVDVPQLRVTGTKAVMIALTGTCLPILIGGGLALIKVDTYGEAFSVGASFAPTSLGVALQALTAGHVHNTPVGGLIVASCIIDDILALLLYTQLDSVDPTKDPSAWDIVAPILSSFGFLIGLGYLSLTYIPTMIKEKLLRDDYSPQKLDCIVLGIMFTLVFAYMPMLQYTKASYLMGVFLAGLTFSQIESAHETFAHNMEEVMAWLLRIFFAATIGFQVPISDISDPEVILWTFIFLIPVISKSLLGFFVPRFDEKQLADFPFNPRTRDAMITGMAMTCRGEFSFIIASKAKDLNLMDDKMYASISFAALLSAIVSPFLLLRTIKYYSDLNEKHYETRLLPLANGETDAPIPLFLNIQTLTKVTWGVQEQIKKAIHDLGLVVIDYRSWQPRGFEASVVTEVFVQDTEMDQYTSAQDKEIDEHEVMVEKRMTELKEAIKEAIKQGGDTTVVVHQWEPQMNVGDDGPELSLKECAVKELDRHQVTDTRVGSIGSVTTASRRSRISRASLFGQNIWENPRVSHEMTQSFHFPQAENGVHDDDFEEPRTVNVRRHISRAGMRRRSVTAPGNPVELSQRLGGFMR
mmetsp:Transcript_24520/g.37837  ORF Transcript_24520/g.37837 Transcript_24520/m.37837 type:complete len:791 (+) Transcript_24520:196-2568(+)|eukprot:CAMPEP_0196807440 /NCGR_PEP_ID=MMETSP1362-20130617/7425_1 /TAXON_ID=163516 /ORGANISM="Leptocylindrus danicus, Strain CCMP1856" /LENGTH=790 /DNA_ID=CAMNT_0042181373 /DNA_START=170 /DNA_END=2542 /DNA_ORIENTATION=-